MQQVSIHKQVSVISSDKGQSSHPAIISCSPENGIICWESFQSSVKHLYWWHQNVYRETDTSNNRMSKFWNWEILTRLSLFKNGLIVVCNNNKLNETAITSTCTTIHFWIETQLLVCTGDLSIYIRVLILVYQFGAISRLNCVEILYSVTTVFFRSIDSCIECPWIYYPLVYHVATDVVSHVIICLFLTCRWLAENIWIFEFGNNSAKLSEMWV